MRFFIIYSPQGALLLLGKYGESAVRGGEGAVIIRVIKLYVLFNINRNLDQTPNCVSIVIVWFVILVMGADEAGDETPNSRLGS